MRLTIAIAVTVFGSLGGWLGAALTNGNWFSLASMGLGVVGSFIGVWAGYKAGQYFGF